MSDSTLDNAILDVLLFAVMGTVLIYVGMFYLAFRLCKWGLGVLGGALTGGERREVDTW